MKLQPASKGPFVVYGATIEDKAGRIARFLSYDGLGDDAKANARYFAHAANVLPGCVEAMERFDKAVDAMEAFHKQDSWNRDEEDKLIADCDAARSALKSALDAARGEKQL